MSPDCTIIFGTKKFSDSKIYFNKKKMVSRNVDKLN